MNIAPTWLLPAIFMLLLILLGLVCFALLKVRRLLQSSYSLRRDTEATRIEVMALFTQIQALLSLERRLGLAEALPPLRGWAGSPDFLLALAEETLNARPRAVLECSSGASTVVIARCLQLNGSGHVFSLEHEPEFARKTRALITRHGLDDWATVVDAPLENDQTETQWYALTGLSPDLPPFELLVVDGPPGMLARLARYPALPQLHSRMAARATILVDDAAREDETEMVRRWVAEFPEWTLSMQPAEKGLAVLRR